MNARQLVDYVRKSRFIRVALIYVPAAWAVMRVVLIAYAGLDAPDWLPRVLALLLTIGFPVAIIVSYAMDIGDREKKAASGTLVGVASGPSRANGPGNKTFGVFLMVGTLVLAGGLYAIVAPQPAEEPSTPDDVTPSVAVLPFVNLSTDESQQLFCDGLSEELLNVLTRVERLAVASRTSSFALRDANLDIRDIGRRLGVTHVIEGSVRMQGDRIRVTAQLIRSDDGFHVWSENYDHDIGDIFETQDTIAGQIVAKLADTTGFKSSPGSVTPAIRTTPDAYIAYLTGKGALLKGDRRHLLLAAERFDQALAMSPAYTPARAGRSYTSTVLGLVGGADAATRTQLFAEALQILDSAPADSWNTAAIAALGISLYEWDRTRDVLELGLGLNENDPMLIALYADLLLSTGNFEDAAYEIGRLQKIAPDLGATRYLDYFVNARVTGDGKEAYLLNDLRFAWHPGSQVRSDPETYERCRVLLSTANADGAADADCTRIAGFIIPSLLADDLPALAGSVLSAQVEARQFDAKLAHWASVESLLDSMPEMRAMLGLQGQ